MLTFCNMYLKKNGNQLQSGSELQPSCYYDCHSYHQVHTIIVFINNQLVNNF